MKILITGGNKSGTTALTYAISEIFDDHAVVTEPPSLAPYIDGADENIIVKFLNPQKYAQNTHYFEHFDIKIMIVRHPFDRLISRLYYGVFGAVGFSNDAGVNEYIDRIEARTQGEPISFGEVYDLFREIAEIGQDEPDDTVLQTLGTHEIAKAGLGFSIIRYEDFIAGDTGAIDDVLGAKVSANVKVPDRLSRVERTKQSDEWRAWMTADDQVRFAQGLGPFAAQFGYDLSAPQTPGGQVDPNGVDYIVKLVNEMRRLNSLPEFVLGEASIGPEGVLFDKALWAMRREEFEDGLALLREAVDLRPDMPELFPSILRHVLRVKEDRTALSIVDLAASRGHVTDAVLGLAIWHLSKRETIAGLKALGDLLDRYKLAHPTALDTLLKKGQESAERDG